MDMPAQLVRSAYPEALILKTRDELLEPVAREFSGLRSSCRFVKLLDLERHLRAHGCRFAREGGAHTLWSNPSVG